MGKEVEIEKEYRNPEAMHPITLAYMGDAVYELMIREHIISRYADEKINELHRKTVQFAKATTQSKIAHALHEQSFFTEEEWTWIKRGRNQHSMVPKNVPPVDYRYATGLETLIGFLYLKSDKNRLKELITMAIELIGI